MATYMKAYTFSFESEDKTIISDDQIIPLLSQIEQLLKNDTIRIIRRINGKLMRVHAYEWNTLNDDYLVVPFGKLKERNRPFGSDPETQKLIEFTEDMFDVTNLAYHRRYRVALLSASQFGPNDSDIENYLNSYLDLNSDIKVRLRPITRSIELEAIRNAHEARSVTISLNVGRPLNDFLDANVNEQHSIQSHLKALMDYSRDSLASNTFQLTLGLGRRKKATLDIGVLMELIDSINLSADCIKEIAVNYRNGPDEKIDIAKLKDTNAILKLFFPINGTELGTEYILNNLDAQLRTDRLKYFTQVQEYFTNSTEIGESYEFVEEWKELPVT